ncbi:alpha/beta hydrolase [Micromonosporaceae bacterium Da 78-11]
MLTAVFVHGACVEDGAWWWSRVAELLRADGVDSISARLPSCGETGLAPGPAGPSLAEDVAELGAVLRAVGPAVVIAHSYGGVVTTEAAVEGDVRHLVFLDSFLPDAGESLASFGGPEPAPYLDFTEDGTFGVRPEMTEALFLQDCDQVAVEGALARLTRQSASVVAEPVRQAAWRRIPSTYLVCAEDLATPPEVQRAQAARAGRVIELPTGHHPMLSRPDLLADVVRELKV